MTIVIRYVRREKDDQEKVRELTLPIKRMTKGHWNWQEFVAMAMFHMQPGERIVAIIEGGYH